ncbi:hypothetical protein CPB84DRAFT_1845752 [Gymnopilus junonius]|uniref:DH domain-containing protein n=1 Tax=Gymnopilus junonius TaxID=109634 RepID=A0A9P5TPM1_GYMJU|nr:hypothetical protein CPB84DRAFT_1845752 [Gymnopilus junonius]
MTKSVPRDWPSGMTSALSSSSAFAGSRPPFFTVLSSTTEWRRCQLSDYRDLSSETCPETRLTAEASSSSLQEDIAANCTVPPAPRLCTTEHSAPKLRGASPVKTARNGPGRPMSTLSLPGAGLACSEKAESRRRIYETEKAYVEGLELIYSHFLTPIIASLDTPEPLLNRSALTAIFSNFIDIWNLHRSFLSALTSLLESPSVTQHDQQPGLSPTKSSAENTRNLAPLPNLSPLLLAHFPYLSLYTPFITAFPSTISSLNSFITPPTSTRPNPQYNQHFASFLQVQENDSRCPRYLLLLKDLIGCTNKEDPEYAQLMAVHMLVSKITSSLNTSLHTHSQTLALLAIQKSTPNLPPTFQLISPGRTFLKRGTLLQLERSGVPIEREFLLFSDCLIWLAAADSSSALPSSWDWAWNGSGSTSNGSGSGLSQSVVSTPVSANTRHSTALLPGMTMDRPAMTRSRSKSEAELASLSLKMESTNTTNSSSGSSAASNPSSSLSLQSSSTLSGKGTGGTATPDSSLPPTPTPTPPVTPKRLTRIRSSLLGGIPKTPKTPKTPNTPHTPPPPPSMPKRPNRHPSTDDKDSRWIFKGRVELVDVQVVVGAGHSVLGLDGDGDESEGREAFAFEVLSPDGSFVLYAASELDRDEWTSEIRSAKAQLLISLNVTHPNSTLTSSASTQHVRKVLQALPYPPSDERLGSIRASASLDVLSSSIGGSSSGGFGKLPSRKSKKEKEKDKAKTKRGASAERRQKVEHWVPAIWIPDGKTSSCMRCGRLFGWHGTKSDVASKPARACDACYETVFPPIDPPEDAQAQGEESQELGMHYHNHDYDTRPSKDTIASLAQLPSWLSMPALPVYSDNGTGIGNGNGNGKERGPMRPQALMAIDLNMDLEGVRKRERERDVFLEEDLEDEMLQGQGGEGDGRERRARVMMKAKSHQRLRSYQDILEDFQIQQKLQQQQLRQRELREVDMEDNEEGEEEAEDLDDGIGGGGGRGEDHSEVHSLASSPIVYSYSPRQRHQRPQRREDTARRSKRFSLPVVALHATSVTARTSVVEPGYESQSPGGASASAGGGNAPSSRSRESSSDVPSPVGQGRLRRFSLVLAGRNSHYYAGDEEAGMVGGGGGGGDLARGVAAAKLSEILGRKMSSGGAR